MLHGVHPDEAYDGILVELAADLCVHGALRVLRLLQLVVQLYCVQGYKDRFTRLAFGRLRDPLEPLGFDDFGFFHPRLLGHYLLRPGIGFIVDGHGAVLGDLVHGSFVAVLVDIIDGFVAVSDRRPIPRSTTEYGEYGQRETDHDNPSNKCSGHAGPPLSGVTDVFMEGSSN